jgi:hypothetical protein
MVSFLLAFSPKSYMHSHQRRATEETNGAFSGIKIGRGKESN